MSIIDRDTDLDTTDALWCHNAGACGRVADGVRNDTPICSHCATLEGARLTPAEVFKLTRAQLIWNTH